ncbi:MAG: PIN domain-containing protein [Bifidobacteriaceae bacterium]|jgi:predicted nucleic acid-binding protein|nr:PIN domain-containing protein [Bifidobacteriaceae bacterium]
MTVRFVDTNVLLYAISTDPGEADKAAVARDILDGADLALSVQVLQEFYVQATRATRANPVSHEQAADLVESFTRFPVQDLTLPVVRNAMRTRERYGLSYWDAAIIESARTLGCRVVLSEDLGHGQEYGGITVVNPFLGGQANAAA